MFDPKHLESANDEPPQAEPTTLPLPFPDWPPREAGFAVPTFAVGAGGLAIAPLRPSFAWSPGWGNQDARLQRHRRWEDLSDRWRSERRRRRLEAILVSQPEHGLPYRPYGDPEIRHLG